MSIEMYRLAPDLIQTAGGGAVVGAQPESLVAKAEAALDVAFPPSYRLFLREMGCGDINGLEVLGLIDDNFKNSGIPDAVWLTLNERRAIGLDAAYMLIGAGGDGTFIALDLRRLDDNGEAEVV